MNATYPTHTSTDVVFVSVTTVAKDFLLYCGETWSRMQTSAVEVVSSTRQAFHKDLTKSLDSRLRNLKGFKRFLQENLELIIRSLQDDVRKPREEARFEITLAVAHVDYLLDNLKAWTSPKFVSKQIIFLLDDVYVHHDPYGVVLVIASWNVPILTLVPVTGAIAGGNCVVIKPSHNSPNFGRLLAKLLPKYLDPSCFPIFLGGIEEMNHLLNERFDYIYYTGSVAVAQIIHRAANKYLTPVTLELGGKNPVFIDRSADLEISAKRVMWGKCYNSGHTCVAPDYVLCSKDVQKQFLVHAKNALVGFFGDASACPIANTCHFERLKKLLEGLNIVIGGGFTSDNCIEPTIAVDVMPDDLIMQEEIFGPILPMVTVEDYKEAVRFVNGREKPLALYIFTRDSSVRDYFINNTSSGAVTVNDTITHLIVEELPFGGVGMSGMGCFKGKYSFDTFVHKKSVLVKNFNKLMESVMQLRYPPYSQKKWDVIGFAIQNGRAPLLVGNLSHVANFLIGFLGGLVFFYFVLF